LRQVLQVTKEGEIPSLVQRYQPVQKEAAEQGR
jgi:hypothetical protein